MRGIEEKVHACVCTCVVIVHANVCQKFCPYACLHLKFPGACCGCAYSCVFGHGCVSAHVHGHVCACACVLWCAVTCVRVRMCLYRCTIGAYGRYKVAIIIAANKPLAYQALTCATKS